MPWTLYRKVQAKRLELAALGAMGTLYFCSYFQRVAVPGTVFNEIQSDLAISAAAVTALGSIFLYIYAGSQVFVGYMADRLGGTRVLLAGGLIMSVGAVVFPLSSTLWLLYASRALVGLGASFMYLSLVKEVDALFGPKTFAPLLGLLIFMGYAGGLVGTFPFERAVSAFGWRHALLGAGLLSCVTLVCVYLLLTRLGHVGSAGAPLSLRPLVQILRNTRAVPVLLCASVNWSIYFLVQAVVGKKLLEDVAGLSSQRAASCTFTMMAVAMVFLPFSGLLSRFVGDRRRPPAIACVTLTLVSAGLLLFAIGHRAPWWVFLVCYVLFAASAGFAPIFIASMKELNRPETVALSVSVLNGACYLGVAVIANLAGLVLDRFKDMAVATGLATVYPPQAYAAIFSGVLAMAAISLVVSFFIRETRGQSVFKPQAAQHPTCQNGG